MTCLIAKERVEKIDPNMFDAKLYQKFNKYNNTFYNKKMKLRKIKYCLHNY